MPSRPKRYRAIVAASLAALLVAGCNAPPNFGNGEVLRDDEIRLAKQGADAFRAIILRNQTDHAGRGAHARGHACAAGTFTVADNIPAEFTAGVFQPGASYVAWARFSNASPDFSGSDDRKPDAHGMALKLLDPPGHPLVVAASGEPSQDFLLTDHPVFFVRDIDEYVSFLEAQPIKRFFFPNANPLSWRLTELLAVKAMLKEAQTPLALTYFSGTAYRLGNEVVKYRASPCAEVPAAEPAFADEPDRLARNLGAALKSGEACFEVAIQRQRDDLYMPVEDATVEWHEQFSTFVTVARLQLPRQDALREDQLALCEQLAFAPWHALPEQRPLGQLNRMRRVMYERSADLRHEANERRVPLAGPPARAVLEGPSP